MTSRVQAKRPLMSGGEGSPSPLLCAVFEGAERRLDYHCTSDTRRPGAPMAKGDLRDIIPLARTALDKGGSVVRPGAVEWKVAGRCENPVRVERWASKASKSGLLDLLQRNRETYLGVDMDVPCRRCPSCLRARARTWAHRAMFEIQRSARTWFGTLTLSPDQHWIIQCKASSELAGRGVAFDQLSASEQFTERHRVIGRELTLWAKRIRKNSSAPLRLFLVAEAHKSGLPHYHLLVHETDPDHQVSYRCLREAWRLGFSKFNLVGTDETSSKVAWYVCKYLTKSNLARVRASENYGSESTTSVIVSEQEPWYAKYHGGERSVKVSPPEPAEGTEKAKSAPEAQPLG